MSKKEKISRIPFEELQKTWRPKIFKMSQKFVPYMDYDDIYQEMSIVLWKCQMNYDENNKASFHTYIHRAMANRMFNIRRDVGRSNPDYNKLVYMGSLLYSSYDDNDPENTLLEYVKHRDKAFSYTDEDSPIVFLEILGFEKLEIAWMLGRSENLYLKDIAKLEKVSVEELKCASRTSKEENR